MKTLRLGVANSVLLISLWSSYAFAGTGQMFSPSGLPLSSTQTYTAPTPGNIPTVTFPTLPLPLGDSLLQGFPGASVPLGEQVQQSTNTSNSPQQSTTNIDRSAQLRGELRQTQSAVSTQQKENKNTTVGLAQAETDTGSIGSFFQCPTATASSKKNKNNSPLKGSGRFIWHVMDNIGIPVPTGSEEDLDPSLKQPYAMPLPKMLKEPAYPSNPQKIPESELEGTDDSSEQPHPSQLH